MVPTGRRPASKPKSPKLAASHEAAELKIAAARAKMEARIKNLQETAPTRIAVPRPVQSVKRNDPRAAPMTIADLKSLARAVGGKGAPKTPRKPDPPPSTVPRRTV